MIVNILIFLAGLAVYGGYGIPGLAYLLAATLLTYLAGLLIPKCRWVLWISVAVNVLVLTAVKAQPVLGWQFVAPLGISYFTFQIIAYNVDVYRGKYPPEKNLFRYAFFVTYIPHLFIGPIEPYDKMRQAAFQDRRITWDGISEGGARFLWGLFKKLVIATRAGVIVGAISADPEQFRGAYALAAMLMYSIQLYTDFSGGIDMVLGGSRMLGIVMSENFDAPYFSQSFQEFWRRWHMTLGAWLRNYVYIPLGGNRKGKVRKFINQIITFLVSGLWHGIHYVLWGFINGMFVALGDRFATRSKLLNQLGTFFLVTLLWSFFVWPDTMTAAKMVVSVFTTFNYGAFFAAVGTLGLTLGDWIVMGAAVAILWLHDWKREGIWEGVHNMTPAGRVAVICTLGLIVLIFGMYGIGFNASEFIYSRF